MTQSHFQKKSRLWYCDGMYFGPLVCWFCFINHSLEYGLLKLFHGVIVRGLWGYSKSMYSGCCGIPIFVEVHSDVYVFINNGY